MQSLTTLQQPALTAYLTGALTDAQRDLGRRVSAPLSAAGLQLYVEADRQTVTLTFRRPKGAVSLTEIGYLLSVLQLDLVSLMKLPAKHSTDPWWVLVAKTR